MQLLRSGQQVQGAAYGTAAHPEHIAVVQGRRYIGVPEQFLHGADAASRLMQRGQSCGAAYASPGIQKKPVNDAEDIRTALEACGFHLITCLYADIADAESLQ